MNLPNRLSFLFGTEDYVNRRRELVLFREELHNNYKNTSRHLHVICSGSFGEGISYPASDDDMMYVDTNVRVVKSHNEATKRNDLLMVPSESSPGYCLLLDINQSCNDRIIVFIGDMPFCSSTLCKQIELREGQYIHGPCLSEKNDSYEYDRALCFKCHFWPDIAAEWVIRNRPCNWPLHDMIQNIADNGCHVVPIGDPESSFSQHEWRISFSEAERTLFHSFNHTQFLTYNILRLVLKRAIDKRIPGVLCSYFMKTTLFYSSEKTPTEFWQLSNIEICFRACLAVLCDFVDQRNCPNYFISEYNMIKRKVNYTNSNRLLEILREFHTTGIVGTLRLCGNQNCLDEFLILPTMEYIQDINFIFSVHVLFCASDTMIILQKSSEKLESWAISLDRIVRFLHDHSPPVIVMNFFFQRVLLFCYLNMNSHQWRMNKCSYRLHKLIEHLLRKGYNVDLTTGKLTAATYMYLIGKTEAALSYIRKLLSEYPPYAIDLTFDRIKMLTYLNAMCGKGYTIDYKVQHAYAPNYNLSVDIMMAIPFPFRIWINIAKSIFLLPLSYSFALESLCYIRLQAHTSLRKSIQCLIAIIDDLDRDSFIAQVKMCVGIIKYVQRDSQSACRWLGSSYVMAYGIRPSFCEKIDVSALTYIACLLNYRFGV